MVLFKTIPRCKVFITNIQTITRPCSNKKGVKIGDKCYNPTPCGFPTSKPPEGKSPDLPSSPEGSSPEGSSPEEGVKGGVKKIGASDEPPPIPTRPVRLPPGKVRMGFLPEEWFDFFYPKTGVTGPYIFFVAFGTYLISKEKYVMEHEYYSLLSMAVLCAGTAKSVGPALARYLDKEIDEYERLWNKQRIDERIHWEEMIEQDERLQISCEGQLMLLDAKRENVKLQLEAAYRERLMYVYNEVKNYLDYHVTIQYIHRKLMHKNLIDWVVKEVIKTYSAEKADADIEGCINELASIAAKEKQ